MTCRTLLFGAFDRHNFGDLLFPHVVAAMLGEAGVAYAGLAKRDLCPVGGHCVAALPEWLAERSEQPVDLIHVGGEVLTCTAWEAGVMLLDPDAANAIVARYDADAAAARDWARHALGCVRAAPYVVSKHDLPQARKVVFNAVGGVELAAREAAMRAEVLASLRAADFVGVRDGITLEHLRQAGIAARLMPDPAVMVAQLFASRIAAAGQSAALVEVRRAMPRGYVALQFSADFADDATLDGLAGQLDRFCAESGLGVVVFRAGAAPWHDALEPCQRLCGKMRAGRTHVFSSLRVWEICALLAGSQAYCGSSLHGRIVAMAHGVPRVNLLHPAQVGQMTKQAAYAATWEVAGMPAVVPVQHVAEKLAQALAVDAAVLHAAARGWEREYLQAFQAWQTLLSR